MIENAIQPVLYTVKEAKKLTGRMIYALCEPCGLPFYVGQTGSPKSRFGEHSRAKSSNSDLNARLAKGDWFVRILEIEPSDLFEAERNHIRANSPGLLNIILADDGRWDSWHKSAKPWAAHRAQPPSGWARQFVSREVSAKVGAMLAKMTDAERCLYELNLWGSWSPRLRDEHQKWFDLCWPRMQKYVYEVTDAA